MGVPGGTRTSIPRCLRRPRRPPKSDETRPRTGHRRRSAAASSGRCPEGSAELVSARGCDGSVWTCAPCPHPDTRTAQRTAPIRTREAARCKSATRTRSVATRRSFRRHERGPAHLPTLVQNANSSRKGEPPSLVVVAPRLARRPHHDWPAGFLGCSVTITRRSGSENAQVQVELQPGGLAEPPRPQRSTYESATERAESMEHVIYQGRTSLLKYWILIGLGGLLVLTGTQLINSPGELGTGYLFALPGLLLVGIAYLNSKRTSYTVTSQRVIQHKGLISPRTSEVKVSDIRNVQVNQNSTERLLGIGNVVISIVDRSERISNVVTSIADWSGLEIVFAGIRNPQEVAEMIPGQRRKGR